MSIANAKRIVVKVGTSTLTYPTGNINIRRMQELVTVLADLKNSGKEIILVSSGAIAVGFGKLGMKKRPTDIPSKQAAAAVGQCELMYLYDKAFGEYNHVVSQILLSRDAFDHAEPRQNIINTLDRLLDMGSIPIVNENDTVSWDEIMIGDNDTLSAYVAELVHADTLILMSDIDGLYDDDPRTNPNAELIPVVYDIDEHISGAAKGAGSENGTGGMATKIHAAQIALKAGIDMYILNGENPMLLYDLFDEQQVGTHFVAK